MTSDGIGEGQELSLGRVYGVLLVAQTGAALLSASTENLGNLSEGKPLPFWYPLIWELTGFYAVLPIVPFMLAATRRWPLSRETWLRHGLVHLALAAVFSVLTTSTFYLLRVALYRLLDLGEYRYGVLGWRYLFEFHKFLVLYVFYQGLFWLYRYTAASRLREAQAARLAQDLAEARLSSLTAQVNPHFLFNALNTVSSVMYDDVRRADRMISQLCDLLRASLAHSTSATVSMADEVRLLGLYVDLMKARFGARLEVTVDVDPEVASLPVPAFLIQPLVENAIKHHPMSEGATVAVRVRASREGGGLVLTVDDNGPGFRGGEGNGVGLANLRARLTHLYGGQHELQLENLPGAGLRVRIHLPERPPQAAQR
jgi:two-component system, LytTR family, sensor kinase